MGLRLLVALPVARSIISLLLWLLLSRSCCASKNYSVVESVSGFPYDTNRRLSSHVLITPDGMCADLLNERLLVVQQQQMHGFELHAVTGPAEMAYFGGEALPSFSPGLREAEDCPAVCLERGVEKSLVTAVLPYRRYNRRQQPFTDWFREGCRTVEFCVANFRTKEDSVLNMYWWNPWKEEWWLRERIRYGSDYLICTNGTIGHLLRFEDDDTKETVFEHRIEYTSTVPIGKPKPFVVKGSTTDFAREIEEALEIEWRKHAIVKRTFSPLGFRKGRLPPEIFANMGAFYYNNRHNTYLEGGWEKHGPYVNWWEQDVNFLQIPYFCRLLWQAALRRLVEEWIGLPLEQTAMYGLRRYESGARLLAHVDRLETHAASLIVNIAQGNVAEPWPVEIHDHSGRLHQIAMEPGDVVYYESAGCLHGRNLPLKGEGAYYVNLFTHYRPVGDPDWWQKENTANTPEPVGDDIGECRVVVDDNEGTTAVTCENPLVGPYLSPSMFTATSGADLFRWWRSVGPNNNIGKDDGEQL